MSSKIGSAGQCPIDQPRAKPYQDLDKDIKELLDIATKANKTTQKLCTIDGIKIAIVFNPMTKSPVTVLPGTILSDKEVLLLSEKKLPQGIVDKIRAIIPLRFGMSQKPIANVGNKTVFQRLGLE